MRPQKEFIVGPYEAGTSQVRFYRKELTLKDSDSR